MRTKAEIREVAERASGKAERERSDWPKLSYEQGVEAALLWAVGDTDDDPFQDDAPER